MADVNMQIQSAIDQFVEQLNGLVRRAALEAVSGALGGASATMLGAGGASRPRRGRPAKSPAIGLAPLFAAPSPGAKRPPEAIAELTERLYQYIEENPGQSIESIGNGMQVQTKALTLPVKKLMAEGRIATEGQKRATKYFPASAKSEAVPAPAARAKSGGKRAAKARGRKRRAKRS